MILPSVFFEQCLCHAELFVLRNYHVVIGPKYDYDMCAILKKHAVYFHDDVWNKASNG